MAMENRRSHLAALKRAVDSVLRKKIDYEAMHGQLVQMYPPTRLREMREAADLTQVELAERMGLTDSYVSKVENGHADVTLDYLAAFAEGLGG
jgi:ribosome-binding protein aMBF1 (putative translation factor)